MPRVTCRCGQVINVPGEGPERIVCPNCEARIRVRRPSKVPVKNASTVLDPTIPPPPGVPHADGFIRFSCPCGRRLKVPAADSPISGKCPDCGRIVPIPRHVDGSPVPEDPEATTSELSAEELARLDEWSKRHRSKLTEGAGQKPAVKQAAVPGKSSKTAVEAGMRVCPKCGKPVHLSAIACRDCGAKVPKR